MPSSFTSSPPQSPSWNHASESKGSSGFPFQPGHAAQPSIASTASSQSHHQRFVLADPVAFSYLEEDRSSTALDRSRKLTGYQCYIVEQWTCSRTHPTFIVVTYTGEQSHSIRVGVLSVPSDEQSWSPRLKLYFKSLEQYNARRKETPLGTILMTNLSNFPSSLTLVSVPDGDIKANREYFIVNEDLKRLGCSGRVGLTLTEPTQPTQAKFLHLYRISSKIPFISAVIELVKLCQTALSLFGCLEPEYVDGLACDFTERGVKDWWTKIGSDLYNVEPSDGLLGPTSVSAILGTLIGARNRLHALSAPVTKDVFDVDSTKRAIGWFQKSQRLPRTRRLDANTLDRLHRATAKQANSEGWAVPKAVKSTVADLSGKGGEMVMEIVGRREKYNISEIETIDIERFAHLVKGERAKWLWQGKARRKVHEPAREHVQSHTRTKSDRLVPPPSASSMPPSSSSVNDPALAGLEPVQEIKSRENSEDLLFRPSESRQGMDTNYRDTMFQRAKGRIRGAVGLRGHLYGQSKEGNDIWAQDERSDSSDNEDDSPQPSPGPRFATGLTGVAAADNSRRKSELRLQTSSPYTNVASETPIDRRSRGLSVKHDRLSPFDSVASLDKDQQRSKEVPPSATSVGEAAPRKMELKKRAKKEEAGTNSMNRLRRKIKELNRISLGVDQRPLQAVGTLLRYNQSFSEFEEMTYESHNDNRWARHLSFSAAEETVLDIGQRFVVLDEEEHDHRKQSKASVVRAEMVKEALRIEESRQLREQIADLDLNVVEWMENKIEEVKRLDDETAGQVTHLRDLYKPRVDEFHALEEGSAEIIQKEKDRLGDSVKDIETLQAKLDYDIGLLKGKVEEVDDALLEFQKGVEYTESRVRELVRTSNSRTWSQWLCDRLTFSFSTAAVSSSLTSSKQPNLAIPHTVKKTAAAVATSAAPVTRSISASASASAPDTNGEPVLRTSRVANGTVA